MMGRIPRIWVGYRWYCKLALIYCFAPGTQQDTPFSTVLKAQTPHLTRHNHSCLHFLDRAHLNATGQPTFQSPYNPSTTLILLFLPIILPDSYGAEVPIWTQAHHFACLYTTSWLCWMNDLRSWQVGQVEDGYYLYFWDKQFCNYLFTSWISTFSSHLKSRGSIMGMSW